MSTRLIEFNWEVSDHGYRWVRTHGIDLSAEDDPRLYITDQQPLGVRDHKVRSTQPLRQFSGRLHRIFAQTETTPEGILNFADHFGMLGDDLPSMIPIDRREGTQVMGLGEEDRKWAAEISQMAFATKLWDLAVSGNKTDLEEFVSWSDDMVMLTPSERSRRLITSKIFKPLRLQWFPEGDLIGPAKVAILDIVNANLWKKGRAAPKLLWNTDTGELEQHLVPYGLIGAIWLDFANAINGQVEYRRCADCGAPFPVSRKGHRRKFCSNKCRIANHRKLKVAAEGLAS